MWKVENAAIQTEQLLYFFFTYIALQGMDCVITMSPS
jgi:hypothetical protein